MIINCHSYYSLRYGTLSIRELVEFAKEYGVSTLALTDINNTSAALDFIRYAKSHGIKPVIVDKDGKVLRKFKTIKSGMEKKHYTVLHRFVFNLKRILGKVGLGGKIGSFAVALGLLLKEDKEFALQDHVEVKEDQKALSGKIKEALEGKVEDHNEKHGNSKTKRATLRMLEAVFRRGVGAYRTNPSSVRPSVSSPDQWAYARVNSFLRALSSGKFRGGKHDTDLFPKGHPLSSK